MPPGLSTPKSNQNKFNRVNRLQIQAASVRRLRPPYCLSVKRLGLACLLAAVTVITGAAATTACMFTLDSAFMRTIALPPARFTAAEITDWYKLLRIMGYAPTWLAVAAAFILVDSTRRTDDTPNINLGGRPLTWSRGPFLAASILLAGLLAEVVKLITRRARPTIANPEELYNWLAWSAKGINTGDLALPSSHAAVAFAAAWAIGKLHPRTLPVGLLLAIGCGTTRLLAGQHHASDIVAAAFVGLLPVVVLTALFDKPRP